MVANSNPTDSSDPDGFVVFDGMLFMGMTSNTYGHEFCALVYEAADAAITCWDLSMGSNSTFPQNFRPISICFVLDLAELLPTKLSAQANCLPR
jgi:hypothetical protein